MCAQSQQGPQSRCTDADCGPSVVLLSNKEIITDRYLIRLDA